MGIDAPDNPVTPIQVSKALIYHDKSHAMTLVYYDTFYGVLPRKFSGLEDRGSVTFLSSLSPFLDSISNFKEWLLTRRVIGKRRKERIKKNGQIPLISCSVITNNKMVWKI